MFVGKFSFLSSNCVEYLDKVTNQPKVFYTITVLGTDDPLRLFASEDVHKKTVGLNRMQEVVVTIRLTVQGRITSARVVDIGPVK